MEGPSDKPQCPICLEIITEACWLMDTRQLYDRHCLVEWFEHGGRCCPATGVPLPKQIVLRAAPALQEEIDARAAAQGLAAQRGPALEPSRPAAKARARRTTRSTRLRELLKRRLAWLSALVEQHPSLYPDLATNNWAGTF